MGFFDKPELIGPGRSSVDDGRVAALEARVARLEALVAGLQGAGPAGDQAWMSDVHALCARGKRIQAIKVYREHTGVGLKEAKDAVDELSPG